MFKPARILQVAALSLSLAGCASTQTAAPMAPNIAPDPAGRPGEAAAGMNPPAESTSIKAGSSVPRAEGFLSADGRLKPDIQAYAQEVSQRRGVPLGHVESLLRAAQYNATAAKLMAPHPARIRRSWVTYKNRFVEPVRIKAGQEFWAAHRARLDAAAKEYGVPPSVIVAIIGVETIYGRHTGNFRVLDALATLGFRYPDSSRPERSQLFRDQLADLIQLDHEKKIDALSATGSFAGAMGLPQFMPGSLMRYAADGDRDGRIDLHGSPDDAIASVARFLRLHGWVPGLPVFAPVTLPANAGTLVKGGLYPTYDWRQLEALGVRATHPAQPAQAGGWRDHKLGVVDLIDEPRKQAEYRLGTPNFFAITHYNRSYFYASSVADLAQALAGKMGYGGPN
ncbi:lytic murein transglycosylase B [Parapusillimonas granuli]|uniref:Lytic murein transglycosylase B n=1 Tax=Parapusillimonas granuli TaxID=380911 RepID=A0A853G580_9BURK|nr:lytic murein transglycosylase B [Parapusillimonas granuli]MBB5217097.1 membrane-bound lytic murein transglycosylase B [Parapusillimonas granuli]MEB2401562.1 lytic murein transglycosylase B [Alcaligenaceae bacterium]NYT50140.1 lytic murein transglycosylase B [Parapusillimonas granuli]